MLHASRRLGFVLQTNLIWIDGRYSKFQKENYNHSVLISLTESKWGSSVTTRNDLVIIAVAAIIPSAVGILGFWHLIRPATLAVVASKSTIVKFEFRIRLVRVSAVSFPTVSHWVLYNSCITIVGKIADSRSNSYIILRVLLLSSSVPAVKCVRKKRVSIVRMVNIDHLLLIHRVSLLLPWL